MRSLRAVQPHAECLCVYAGADDALLAALAAENIPVARHKPRITPDALSPKGQRCAGCFLKLELALLPELSRDPLALYCDTDVLFRRPLDELLALTPRHMAMAREYTAPFFHPHQELRYTYQGREYVTPMPFPIWTFSSGVALFNLDRLRRHGLIEHFLAFCRQNERNIGNLDQSLLNYFFGKRITRLEDRWNCPPYREECRAAAHIVHFHGPKPWQTHGPLADLRINHFDYMRRVWLDWLRPDERALAQSWEAKA